MVFVTPQSLGQAQAQYADIKQRAAAHGRDPDHIKIMPGLAPVVGRTEAEAQEKFEQLQSLLTLPVALNILSMKLGGMDLSRFDIDRPFPETARPPAGSRPSMEALVDRSLRENLSVRELAFKTSGSLAGLSVHGSAAQIADMMEAWFIEGACDGFNLQPAVLPGTFRDMVDLVLPELRRRGLFRSEYEGQTLRENLGLPRPASRYALQ